MAWQGLTAGEGFTHPAVFYRTLPEYLAYVVPFILDGQADHEPVAVAVPGPNLHAIQMELAARGGDVDQVRWLDMTEAGRNPGRIIPTVLRAFADRHPHQRVRIVGEPVWAGRDEAEYPACVQHEALIKRRVRRSAGHHPVSLRRPAHQPGCAGRRQGHPSDPRRQRPVVGQSRLCP